jgi:hypothetical protein
MSQAHSLRLVPNTLSVDDSYSKLLHDALVDGVALRYVSFCPNIDHPFRRLTKSSTVQPFDRKTTGAE